MTIEEAQKVISAIKYKEKSQVTIKKTIFNDAWLLHICINLTCVNKGIEGPLSMFKGISSTGLFKLTEEKLVELVYEGFKELEIHERRAQFIYNTIRIKDP